MKIGYARVSTGDQDLAAQTDALKKLGVDEKRIYIDHGLTGTNRSRPGLREALAAASRPGDELVVTKLDRLARSIRDAKDIADELAGRGVTLRLGASAYDPTDPMGRMMFNVLATFATAMPSRVRIRMRAAANSANVARTLNSMRPMGSVGA